MKESHLFCAGLAWVVLGCGVAPHGRTMGSGAGQRGDAVSVCAGSNILQGVDVSQYDGTVNWSAARSGGLTFAIARISDGTGFPDPDFQANWSGMQAAGVVRGAYQFFEAGDDITAEANMVVTAVGMLGASDLPVTIDIEDEPSGSIPTIAQIQSWTGIVQQGTGKAPMIYCAEGYWDAHFGAQFSTSPLWVANWQVSCPNLPTGWSAWAFWQYSATGTAPGVSSPGQSDLDEFDGTLNDLEAFAAGTTPTCGAAQSTCTSTSQCCSGLSCQSSVCTASATCTGLHGGCSTASSCCTGMACEEWSMSGANPSLVCCDGVGATCAQNSDCCGGVLCTAGTCVCVPQGQFCSQDADCCTGLSCQGGSCQTIAGCGAMHAGCSTNAGCCGGLSCQEWSATGVNPSLVCCDGVGATCAQNSDCCGGVLCTAGTCACVPQSQFCNQDADCCAGLDCQGSSCQPGASSSSSTGSSGASSGNSTVGASSSAPSSSAASGSSATAGTSGSTAGSAVNSATASGTAGTSTSRSSSGDATTGAGGSTTGSGATTTSATGSESAGGPAPKAKAGGCESAAGTEMLSLLVTVLGWLADRPRRRFHLVGGGVPEIAPSAPEST